MGQSEKIVTLPNIIHLCKVRFTNAEITNQCIIKFMHKIKIDVCTAVVPKPMIATQLRLARVFLRVAEWSRQKGKIMIIILQYKARILKY